MASISLKIPNEMEEYADDLEFFFRIMVKKLFTNRHRGFSKDFDLGALIGGLEEEIDEMKEALAKEGQFEVAVETADAANYAFLIALTVLHMNRKEFDESRVLLKGDNNDCS